MFFLPTICVKQEGSLCSIIRAMIFVIVPSVIHVSSTRTTA